MILFFKLFWNSEGERVIFKRVIFRISVFKYSWLVRKNGVA